MIAYKKEFYGGLGMLIGFLVIIIIIFSPVFNGQNALEYSDALYNSISKGSAYYIPKVKEETDKFIGNIVTVSLDLEDKDQARQTALLFEKAGARASVTACRLELSGDLGKIMGASLEDADAMYENDGKKVSSRYGYDERRVLYYWWKAFKGMDTDLKKQGKFREAKVIALVSKKAIESSYNYYKIEPQKISDRLGVVLFSLVFYVVYTLWYGFSIMFMFEGWGLRLEH